MTDVKSDLPESDLPKGDLPKSDLMEKIVSLCKRRGFIFQSAEIYGGFRSTYDYGPLGVNMLRNVKDAWWRTMVQERDDVVGLDASILSPPRVWEASGHISNFTDPMVDCRSCHERHRADQIEGVCPNCGSKDLTEARQFNLMFQTQVGPVAGEGAVAYLRPETARGNVHQLRQRGHDVEKEATVRHSADRKGLQKRDNPPELRIPHP